MLWLKKRARFGILQDALFYFFRQHNRLFYKKGFSAYFIGTRKTWVRTFASGNLYYMRPTFILSAKKKWAWYRLETRKMCWQTVHITAVLFLFEPPTFIWSFTYERAERAKVRRTEEVRGTAMWRIIAVIQKRARLGIPRRAVLFSGRNHPRIRIATRIVLPLYACADAA